MPAPVPIPTPAHLDHLWSAYAALVRQQLADPTLFVSLEHCQRVARAWGTWRDAFLRDCAR